jgi:hypothetical protein
MPAASIFDAIHAPLLSASRLNDWRVAGMSFGQRFEFLRHDSDVLSVREIFACFEHAEVIGIRDEPCSLGRLRRENLVVSRGMQDLVEKAPTVRIGSEFAGTVGCQWPHPWQILVHAFPPPRAEEQQVYTHIAIVQRPG